MKGVKVLSLDIFHYIFVVLNVMGLMYELLLVFVKNCMLTACLLHEIQGTENSWLCSMIDFNKIC